MSFILKALKKLEDEKAARDTGAIHIKSAILAHHSRPHSSPRKSAGWMLIVLVFLAGGIMTYFILRHTNPVIVQRKEKDIQPVQVTQTVQTPQTVFQGGKSKLDDEVVSPPAKILVERTLSQPIIQERTPEASPATPPMIRSMTEQVANPGTATTSLTVNGIAIQDDPAESIAVVNGVIVKQGVTIGGAQVDRIFLNRVRFKREGGTFEVHLAK
jgi:hypothetical protein